RRPLITSPVPPVCPFESFGGDFLLVVPPVLFDETSTSLDVWLTALAVFPVLLDGASTALDVSLTALAVSFVLLDGTCTPLDGTPTRNGGGLFPLDGEEVALDESRLFVAVYVVLSVAGGVAGLGAASGVDGPLCVISERSSARVV